LLGRESLLLQRGGEALEDLRPSGLNLAHLLEALFVLEDRLYIDLSRRERQLVLNQVDEAISIHIDDRQPEDDLFLVYVW